MLKSVKINSKGTLHKTDLIIHETNFHNFSQATLHKPIKFVKWFYSFFISPPLKDILGMVCQK